MSMWFGSGKQGSCFRLLVLIFFCAQMLMCSGHGTAAAEPLPALEIAESMTGEGPEVLAAIASMGRDSQLEELERQRMGARYFFNATFGYSDEPLFETSEESASYSKLGVGAGIIFPIFGTWSRQKVAALESEIRSIESAYRTKTMKLYNLTALRKAYVTLWSECEKTAVSKRFLETEAGSSKILALREKQGLILPAYRLEFMMAYDEVRRDIAFSAFKKTQALQIIRLATGRLWDMPERMEIPTLPSLNALKTDFDSRPELAMMRETLKKYEELMLEKRNISREASFTIGANAAKDFPGEIGSGVYASVNISEPLGTAFSKDDKAGKAAEEDYKRAQREELFMRIKLQGEAEEAASLAAYAAANIRAREKRLAALTESVREKIMRRASISGDTLEQLQESRYRYYQGVMDIIDSEMMFMQTGADLLSYAYPEGVSSEPSERMRPIADNELRRRMLHPDWLVSEISVPGGSMQVLPIKDNAPSSGYPGNIPAIKPVPEKKGSDTGVKNTSRTFQPGSVYVWDAAPFLSPKTRTSSLRELRSKGFDHFLISFTGAQIKDLDDYKNRIDLEYLLLEADSMGIRADLLLGDPTWLYPDRRKGLTDLIEKMKKFRFKGIHLDIEPDSLPGAGEKRNELLVLLAETLKDVNKTEVKNLSVSIHPRYLEGELGTIFAKYFPKLGLEYVSVMLYSTNRETASERMRGILESHPAMKFYLAQSVERSLGAAESYYPSGMGNYSESMEFISNKLAGSINFAGILIQSWEDYGGMVR